MEEEGVRDYLDNLEDIALKTRELQTGDVVPKIKLLICNDGGCEKCKDFALTLADVGRGDIIDLDSSMGMSLSDKFGLTCDDLPALIANDELQYIKRSLNDIEFADWFEHKYGFRP